MVLCRNRGSAENRIKENLKSVQILHSGDGETDVVVRLHVLEARVAFFPGGAGLPDASGIVGQSGCRRKEIG